MDLIQFRTWFPRFLPIDVIDVIYYLVGQRSPTCNIMANHISSVSSHFKKLREYSNNLLPTYYFCRCDNACDFNKSTDTLWNAAFWWHLPKFLTRTAELCKFTRAEVDLTIAYHQLQQTICHSKIDKQTERNAMTAAMEGKLEWHKVFILDLQDHLSERSKTECLEIDKFERGVAPS